jgi:hypothetical protein
LCLGAGHVRTSDVQRLPQGTIAQQQLICIHRAIRAQVTARSSGWGLEARKTGQWAEIFVMSVTGRSQENEKEAQLSSGIADKQGW